MQKKYELTDETIEFYDETLRRIRALTDFGNVKKGDLGGFIEKEKNLSHDGNCWVGDNAKVFGGACVSGNANVFGNAQVYGEAYVYDNAQVFGNAKVRGGALIYNNAQIFDNAEILGAFLKSIEIFGNAKIYDSACIHDEVKIFRNAEVCGLANIRGNTRIPQDIKI